MNAPAQIAPAKTTPSRDRYIPIVKQHLPVCRGKELELRCSLLMMRDKASSSLTRCSDDAYYTLHEVQRLAAAYAYVPMPLDELEQLRYQLLRLTSCASGLEMFAYRLANPNAGGKDEGG